MGSDRGFQFLPKRALRRKKRQVLYKVQFHNRNVIVVVCYQ
jgi:hypothetical protein